MAKEKLDFQAALNIDINLESGKEQIEKMLKNLSLVNSELKGVSSARMKKAQDLSKNVLSPLLAQDPSKMNKEERVEYQRKLNAAVNEYNAIMNSISAAAIQHLAKTKEQKDEIEAVNKEYRSTNALIKQYLDQLGEVANKSKLAKEAIQQSTSATAKATGIDPSSIKSVRGTNQQIKMLEGKTDAKSKADLKLLEAHKKLLQEQSKIVKEQEKEYDRINGQLKEQFDNMSRIRQRKLEVTQQILKQAAEEGDITEEQREGLGIVTQELAVEQKITQEKQKQKAQQKGSAIKEDIKQAKDQLEANEGVRQSFLGKITAATVYYAALRALRKLMSSVINTVRDLDKSLTEVAMVTSMTRKEAWQLVSAYQNLAHEIGTTTDEIAKLSVYFFRQGRTQKDALELTRVAAIAAKVASIDATESANFLTSAINGFGMAADQALEVSDKFAALAASSASSYQELAVALSKVAPSANMAGVSIDFMMGVLAKGIETTREAPENIGTAFKTVFARMMQIREFGATLDDATGVNKVEEALKQADVSLRDSTGTFRDMDVVLRELGQAWPTLTRNQQSYIATALAGTRQQTRLLAVMQDFDRTMELVDISMNSLGATFAQQAEYSSGMQAATARLNNAWEKFILTLTKTEVIIQIINTLTEVIDTLADEVKRNGGLIAGMMSVIGIAVIALALKFGKLGLAITAATGGMNLLIPALIAGAVVIYSIFREGATEAEKFADKVKDLNEDIKQNQVDIYNYRKTTTELKNLIERYEQLDNQVVKTAEELEEMNEILEQIDKYSNEDYDLVINGKFNDDLKEYLDIMHNELRTAEQTQLDLGKDTLNAYAESILDDNLDFDFDPSNTEAVIAYMAQIITGSNDIFQMSAEDQADIFDLIRSNWSSYKDDFGNFFANIQKIDSQIENLRGIQGSTEAINIIHDFEDGLITAEEFLDTYGVTISAFKNMYQTMISQGAIQEQTAFFNNYIQDITKTLTLSKELVQRVPPLADESLKLFQDLKQVLAGTFEGDQNLIFDALFASPDKDIIAKAIPELASLLGFGMEEASKIAIQKMKNATGEFITSAQKISIIKALEQSGLSKEEIIAFFEGRTEFTAQAIQDYLESIQNQFTGEEVTQFQNLATDLFDILTNKQGSENFMNSIERAKNTVDTVLELQEKLKNEGLTAEEFATIQNLLGGGEFLDDFFAGTLTADFQSEAFDGIKNNLQQALDAALAELEFDAENQLLQNEVASLQFLLNNIDDMFNSDSIDNYYQSQIDYIKQLNTELQQQVSLEQQKMDMNRSMLSLNRQIRALERDTSYGAQAALADLEMTREREAMSRQAFLMDMVANQQIQQLESQMAQARDEAVLDISQTVDDIYNFFKNQAGVNPFTIYTGNTSG